MGKDRKYLLFLFDEHSFFGPMNFRKLLNKYGAEELAESFVFPVKYTAKQQANADKELAEARLKSQAAMTEEQKIQARILQLKFQSEGE
jgi:hypothetical protein